MEQNRVRTKVIFDSIEDTHPAFYLPLAIMFKPYYISNLCPKDKRT